MESVESLSDWQQISYGAALVTRMKQNYMLFCQVSGQGDGRVFQDILQLAWEFAAGQNNTIDFLKQQEKLALILPDPDQFDGFGVWPALDATTALCALLSACHHSDVDEILSVEKLSQSTIEHYLQFSEKDSIPGQHPLTLADREFSSSVIQRLQEMGNTTVRKDCVVSIKSWVQEIDVSNIGVTCAR